MCNGKKHEQRLMLLIDPFDMSDYEKILKWWKSKNIKNDAELAEALNGYSILFAYHSGKMENDKITYHDTREIFDTVRIL